MSAPPVLRQRTWNDEQLKKAGFRYYKPVKRLVMARVLQEKRQIDVTLETLVAGAGDIVCYTPGDVVQPRIDDYDHWPVRADLFKATYRPWDETPWKPSPTEVHLMRGGCRPYYKIAGVWALRLARPIYIQSLESPEPVLVPAGRWLVIGSKGEPYHISDEKFRARYVVA